MRCLRLCWTSSETSELQLKPCCALERPELLKSCSKVRECSGARLGRVAIKKRVQRASSSAAHNRDTDF